MDSNATIPSQLGPVNTMPSQLNGTGSSPREEKASESSPVFKLVLLGVAIVAAVAIARHFGF